MDLPPTPAPPALPGHRRKLALMGLLAVPLLGSFLAWQRWRSPVPPPPVADPVAVSDPRLTFATPYRNVRPEVPYVGDEACARCHPEIADRYRRHPMGRSFAPIARLLASDPAVAAPSSFEAQGLHYAVERRGPQLFHRESLRSPHGEVLAERAAEIRYVIGSGTRGYTFVWGENGFLFQSPISWYTQKKTWDLSPDYREQNQHFDGPLNNSCLFCHCNQVEPIADTINGYQEPLFQGGGAIGCERCHGPGGLHVSRQPTAETAPGRFDDTIVNPRRLEPGLREAVCQQCHLQGQGAVMRRGRQVFDYRPGLPVQLFWSVFFWPAGAASTPKAVGQVEQMYASRCYRSSAGRLGCISCHDPHEQPAPEKKIAIYRQRCLNCHEQKTPCRLPPAERRRQAGTDDCVSCHMPRLATDIIHTAATDHRIVRRPSPAAPQSSPPPYRPGDPLLLTFPGDQPAPEDWEASRDLGVALMQMALGRHPPEAIRTALIQQALPHLERALARAPDDSEAWEAWGNTRMLRSDPAGALAAYEHALAPRPRRELALTLAGTAAAQLDRDAGAREFWQRAQAVNRWRWQYPYHLARLAVKSHDAVLALQHCQEALRLNPAAMEARMLQVWSLLALGNKPEAERAFAALLALKPPQAEAMRSWFAEQMRLPSVLE
jgi:predicted CXXCH cytochrome family protein